MHQAVIAARESRDREREEAERPKPRTIIEWDIISATILPTPTGSAPAQIAQAPPPRENQQSEEHDNYHPMPGEVSDGSQKGSSGPLADGNGDIDGPTTDGSPNQMDTTGNIDLGPRNTGKEVTIGKKALSKGYNLALAGATCRSMAG